MKCFYCKSIIEPNKESLPLSVLNLSPKTIAALAHENVQELCQLLLYTEDLLLNTTKVGKRGFNEIRLALKKIGMQLLK
jgi:DNA-directed RNA polymerase alpha subunit